MKRRAGAPPCPSLHSHLISWSGSISPVGAGQSHAWLETWIGIKERAASKTRWHGNCSDPSGDAQTYDGTSIAPFSKEMAMNFTLLNRICWTICIISIAAGTALSFAMIWGQQQDNDFLTKSWLSIGVLFFGSAA